MALQGLLLIFRPSEIKSMKGGNSKDSWRDQTEVVSQSLNYTLNRVGRMEIYSYLYNKFKVMKFESTLASIASLVWEAKTADQARTILVDHLSDTRVKDRDKMIQDIEQLKTLQAIQRYTANALLKFEGLSTKS